MPISICITSFKIIILDKGGVCYAGKQKKDIRRTAAVVREKCKVSRYGIIDLFKECARLGYKLIRYPLGENADLGFTIKKIRILLFSQILVFVCREKFLHWHMNLDMQSSYGS